MAFVHADWEWFFFQQRTWRGQFQNLYYNEKYWYRDILKWITDVYILSIFSDDQHSLTASTCCLMAVFGIYSNKNSNDTNLCWKFGRMIYVLLDVFSSTAVSVIFLQRVPSYLHIKTCKMESLTTLHCGKNGSVTFQLWPTGVFKTAIKEGV